MVDDVGAGGSETAACHDPVLDVRSRSDSLSRTRTRPFVGMPCNVLPLSTDDRRTDQTLRLDDPL